MVQQWFSEKMSFEVRFEWWDDTNCENNMGSNGSNGTYGKWKESLKEIRLVWSREGKKKANA